MAGARVDDGSPSSSDDESSGGAPLYESSPSPENRASRAEETTGFPHQTKSTTTQTDYSTDKNLTAESEFGDEQDPRTPSDQGIRTPDPIKPRRSFSKSTLRAAARVFTQPTSASVGGVQPALTLSAYPGPAAAAQHQPTLPLLVPVAVATTQPQGHPPVPGSTTHSFISAMQAMNLNAAEDNLHPSQKTHRDETCKIQARVWGLRQGLYRQTSIPQEFLTSFDYDVQELMNNTVKMNQAIDNLAGELKKALAEQERIRGLEATIRDLEGDLSDYKERSQNAEKTLASIAGRSDEDMRTIQFLKEQLRQNEMARTILQEQVNGKRSLWLNVHNDPHERAAVLDTLARSSTPLSGQTFAMPGEQSYAASVRAPGSVRSGSSHSTSVHSGLDRSSSATGTSGNVNGSGFHYGGAPHLGGSFAGGSYAGGYPSPFQSIPHSHSGPAVYPSNHHHQRRMSNATATSGRSSVGYATSRHSGGPPSRPTPGLRRTRVTITTETGSPKERKRATPRSIVRPDLEGSDSQKWADEFQSLFALIYGFCASYFHELPVLDEEWMNHVRGEANGELWDYVCKICCQTTHESDQSEYALRLLKDRDSRPYLMQRLILQHILIFVCGYEGWKDYSVDADEEMEKLDKDLKRMDPSKTYDRQMIINRRAQLVEEMVAGPNAAKFKNFKLTQHHQYLKTMVAPFLATHKAANVANEAFYDLFTITTTAWDLSAKMFASRLTFQYVWNDAGVRFAAETHEPLDCSVDRLTLQYEHCRIRFCATPAVTVRNDQGMTIDAKNILKAGVLVMRY